MSLALPSGTSHPWRGARRINGAPNLAVHRPFGGTGISGVGREGGRAGFEEFLRVKSVAITIH
jgi:acyl-CoA reductase-like NAD-dependent aldehyde dehydrogenase